MTRYFRHWEACKHFWQVRSAFPKDYSHALACCKYCDSWTVIDRSGVGPCAHSMGQRVGEQYFHGEPFLEKEDPAFEGVGLDAKLCVDCQKAPAVTGYNNCYCAACWRSAPPS